MPRFAFGPVASRRLGLSLGVNNVPCKTCTYSCVYCQLERTTNLTLRRGAFYDWREVVGEVLRFLRELAAPIDYVTFVPDGEPLLDTNLGRAISAIKGEACVRVAVLTNASLLSDEGCRADLAEADLVSVKVDAVTEGVWKRLNRPHPDLRIDEVLEGLREFSRGYGGRLVTETMLIEGFNDGISELEAVAKFVTKLSPRTAYISVPTRPTAEPYAAPPDPGKLVEACSIFVRHVGHGRVELLNVPEPPPPVPRGDPVDWLLSVASVHPLRFEHAVNALEKLGEDPLALLGRLEAEGLIRIVSYGGSRFIVRAPGKVPAQT